MQAPALEIEGLAFRHPPAAAGERAFELRLAHLSIARGEMVALVGPSGCGKSTLLDLLGLILRPTALRRYLLRGADGGALDLAAQLSAGDVDGLAPVRRSRLGYVLQQGGLLPFLTVRENIEAVGRRRGTEGDPAGALAERLGVAHLLRRYPAQLSIGQRQRVGVARALYAEPDLVLADEPTSSLDPPAAEETLDLFVEAARDRGAAVLMANHDWALVARRGFARLSPTMRRDEAAVLADFAREAA